MVRSSPSFSPLLTFLRLCFPSHDLFSHTRKILPGFRPRAQPHAHEGRANWSPFMRAKVQATSQLLTLTAILIFDLLVTAATCFCKPCELDVGSPCFRPSPTKVRTCSGTFLPSTFVCPSGEETKLFILFIKYRLFLL